MIPHLAKVNKNSIQVFAQKLIMLLRTLVVSVRKFMGCISVSSNGYESRK